MRDHNFKRAVDACVAGSQKLEKPMTLEEDENGDVQTIRLGDYIAGYDEIISDHRPVVWRFTP